MTKYTPFAADLPESSLISQMTLASRVKLSVGAEGNRIVDCDTLFCNTGEYIHYDPVDPRTIFTDTCLSRRNSSITQCKLIGDRFGIYMIGVVVEVLNTQILGYIFDTDGVIELLLLDKILNINFTIIGRGRIIVFVAKDNLKCFRRTGREVFNLKSRSSQMPATIA